MKWWMLLHVTDASRNIKELQGRVNWQGLKKGRRLARGLPPSARGLLATGRGPLADYLHNQEDVPVLSQRLWQHLEPIIGKDVQSFSLSLVGGSRAAIDTTAVVINILRKVKCVDWKLSEPWRKFGRVIAFRRLSLIGRALSGYDIFRPVGATHQIWCSDALARSLAGKGFRGIGFGRLPLTGEA